MATQKSIMNEAHKIAKKLTGHYAARMSFALKMAYKKFALIAYAKAKVAQATYSTTTGENIQKGYYNISVLNTYSAKTNLIEFFNALNDRNISAGFIAKMKSELIQLKPFLHLV